MKTVIDIGCIVTVSPWLLFLVSIITARYFYDSYIARGGTKYGLLKLWRGSLAFLIAAFIFKIIPFVIIGYVHEPTPLSSDLDFIGGLIFWLLIIAAMPGIILPVMEFFRLKNNKYRIVLLRHGESVWNKENRFTGWTDVELSDLGREEARIAGQILKKEGYAFDLVFTSVLKRAIQTTDIVMEKMGLQRVETKYAWQLNERHYGGLQGLNKAEMAAKYGEDQVHIWRRSYAVRPPGMDDAAFEEQNVQEIFKTVSPGNMPRTESLSDTYDRAVAYWGSNIAPELRGGKKVLVSAHGNSLRAIVKFLDRIPDDKISDLNIPTGVPLVYELDENLNSVRHYYLGDQGEIEAKINKVKNQGKGGETIAPKI